MIRIALLRLHPVKSLRGIDVERVRLGRRGLVGDRELALIDAGGRVVHQRWLPGLAALEADVDGRRLTVRAGGAPPLEVDLEGADDARTERAVVTVHGAPAPALVQHDARVAAWFEARVGVPLRLARFDDRGSRPTTLRAAGAFNEAAFDDGYPISILSQASLDDLGRRLADPALSSHRFRANLVVSGTAPFEEDEWRAIRINGARFNAAKRTMRCKIVGFDPQSGASDPRPLEVLAGYRRFDEGIAFGSYFLHDALGELARGMRVEVLERRSDQGAVAPGPQESR